MNKQCIWTKKQNDSGMFKTSCGQPSVDKEWVMFVIIMGGGGLDMGRSL